MSTVLSLTTPGERTHIMSPLLKRTLRRRNAWPLNQDCTLRSPLSPNTHRLDSFFYVACNVDSERSQMILNNTVSLRLLPFVPLGFTVPTPAASSHASDLLHLPSPLLVHRANFSPSELPLTCAVILTPKVGSRHLCPMFLLSSTHTVIPAALALLCTGGRRGTSVFRRRSTLLGR